ncbi:hypothetical protein LCGC14_2186060 [marine sediment metagenome]|uniref:Uncharacterized protein n=1 Tax=marine sediment metagenome TaxID=412755 RepID=A0A0F9DKX6_9ZZZZ
MLDGTEKPKDDITPKVEQETPKETFTKEEVDKLEVDFRTAAAAEVGRATQAAEKAAKQADEAVKQAQKANDRTNKYIEQARTAELEINKDQPDALTLIRARHAKEELEDKLATTNTELETANQTIVTMKTQSAVSTKEQNAREIAGRFQVDVEDLLLTDGSKEAMEKLAQKLTKVEPKEALKIDPGGGGGGDKSFESLLKVDTKGFSYQEIVEHEQKLKSAMKA